LFDTNYEEIWQNVTKITVFLRLLGYIYRCKTKKLFSSTLKFKNRQPPLLIIWLVHSKLYPGIISLGRNFGMIRTSIITE